VYAALQVPAGLLLDRFGSRRMLATGALVMAAGQLLMSSADSLLPGIAARVLVGAGDAMTFGSAVRLVPAWFAPRRVPVITQLTGIIGQTGQIASAFPFAYALHQVGWTWTFRAAAVAGLAGFVVALALVRDDPAGRRTEHAADPVPLRTSLARTWRTPGTRLGLWTHGVTGFAPMVFAMMWGYPYLVDAEGRSPAEAGWLMTIFVVAAVPCGPVLGRLTQQYPRRRSTLVLAIAACNALPWVAILLWPGPAPLWLLVLLVLGLATGGPGSAIGFDYARTSVPPSRLGTATGIVIMGGFTGALVGIQLVGLTLDLVTGGAGHPDLGQFRTALAVQLPLFAIGVAGVLHTRRRVRAQLPPEERPDPVRAALARRIRRARSR